MCRLSLLFLIAFSLMIVACNKDEEIYEQVAGFYKFSHASKLCPVFLDDIYVIEIMSDGDVYFYKNQQLMFKEKVNSSKKVDDAYELSIRHYGDIYMAVIRGGEMRLVDFPICFSHMENFEAFNYFYRSYDHGATIDCSHLSNFEGVYHGEYHYYLDFHSTITDTIYEFDIRADAIHTGDYCMMCFDTFATSPLFVYSDGSVDCFSGFRFKKDSLFYGHSEYDHHTYVYESISFKGRKVL